MKDADYFYQKGLENNLIANYPGAVIDYSKAIEIDTSYLEAYLKRGTLYYKLLKRYEDALSDFNTAVELDKGCVHAHLHRGIVKCHLLKFADSLADFDWAIRLDPNDERAFYNRGKSKYMLKYNKEDVCADLEMAIKLGSIPAADMIKLFYGEDEQMVREAISQGIKKKAGK
jgi:tetratricopeptide (TPR) repeat protein